MPLLRCLPVIVAQQFAIFSQAREGAVALQQRALSTHQKRACIANSAAPFAFYFILYFPPSPAARCKQPNGAIDNAGRSSPPFERLWYEKGGTCLASRWEVGHGWAGGAHWRSTVPDNHIRRKRNDIPTSEPLSPRAGRATVPLIFWLVALWTLFCLLQHSLAARGGFALQPGERDDGTSHV